MSVPHAHILLFAILVSLTLHSAESLPASDVNASETTRSDTSSNSGWLSDSFTLTSQSLDLFRAINDARNYGLNPDDYFPAEAKSLLEQIRANRFATSEDRANAVMTFQTVMKNTYLALARDLYYGRSDFVKLALSAANANRRFDWGIPSKKNLALESYLSDHLKRNTIYASLHALHPDYAEYFRLADSLRFYRSLNTKGDWKPIPKGPTIRIGMSDPRLPLIQQRLNVTRDLDVPGDINLTRYDDPTFIEAVRSFQRRHNLSADGVIGPATLQALNIPLETKIEQIALNLERFRHLPAGLEPREGYIDVNIPAYTLRVYEAGYFLFSMKTIVGRKERPTPLLLSRLAYAVANPTWTVPSTIVKEDMLEAGKIASHVDHYQMRVYAHTKKGLVEVNPDAIRWEKYTGSKRLPFTFKADAGNANPLGKLKFIFPNPHSVYLHDTNTPALFEKNDRSLSSGCVRISDPQTLFRYLTEVPEEEDDPTVNGGSDIILPLKKRLPVLFRYMTVSVSEDGKTYFYDDIYDYDRTQREFEKGDLLPGSDKEPLNDYALHTD